LLSSVNWSLKSFANSFGHSKDKQTEAYFFQLDSFLFLMLIFLNFSLFLMVSFISSSDRKGSIERKGFYVHMSGDN